MWLKCHKSNIHFEMWLCEWTKMVFDCEFYEARIHEDNPITFPLWEYILQKWLHPIYWRFPFQFHCESPLLSFPSFFLENSANFFTDLLSITSQAKITIVVFSFNPYLVILFGHDHLLNRLLQKKCCMYSNLIYNVVFLIMFQFLELLKTGSLTCKCMQIQLKHSPKTFFGNSYPVHC